VNCRSGRAEARATTPVTAAEEAPDPGLLAAAASPAVQSRSTSPSAGCPAVGAVAADAESACRRRHGSARSISSRPTSSVLAPASASGRGIGGPECREPWDALRSAGASTSGPDGAADPVACAAASSACDDDAVLEAVSALPHVGRAPSARAGSRRRSGRPLGRRATSASAVPASGARLPTVGRFAHAADAHAEGLARGHA